MNKKILSWLVAIAFTLIFSSVVIAPPTPTRTTIKSMWTNSPPSIDGHMSAGEWSNLQITMTSPFPVEAYAYFLNDNNYLYVLVDAVGDTTNNPSDECLLVFDFANNVMLKVFGDSSKLPATGFDAAAGFDTSPNSPAVNHRIFEIRIPLSLINIEPGESVDICSPAWKGRSIVYDVTGNRDNIWPSGLNEGNLNTWGLLETSRESIPATSISPILMIVLLGSLAVIGAKRIKV